MGCTSAKPRPPEVARPPTLEGQLPMKKNSAALFSRGESIVEDTPDEEGKSVTDTKVLASGGASGMVEMEIPGEPTPQSSNRANELSSSETVVKVDERPAPTEIAVSLTDATYEPKETSNIPPPLDQSPQSPADIPPPPESPPASPYLALPEQPQESESQAIGSDELRDKLNKVEVLIYSSAEAALNSKGLKKYVPEMTKRGVITYRQLADMTEDLEDPFWSRMPPYPDRKRMRGVVDEARAAYGLPPMASGSAPTSPSQPPDEIEPPAEEPPAQETIDNGSGEMRESFGDMEAGSASAKRTPPALPVGFASGEAERAEGEVEAPPPPTPPRQKQDTPCDDYETDIYATEFGICYCGHPKKAHKAGGAIIKTPSYVQRQASAKMETPKDGSICQNYRIDTTAAKFGTCVCGHPKAAHTMQSEASSNRFKDMAKGSFNQNSPMTKQLGSGVAPANNKSEARVPPPPPKVAKPQNVEPAAVAPAPSVDIENESSEVDENTGNADRNIANEQGNGQDLEPEVVKNGEVPLEEEREAQATLGSERKPQIVGQASDDSLL